jgi:hypothetical protein
MKQAFRPKGKTNLSRRRISVRAASKAAHKEKRTMKIQIATAVMTGILSLIPGSPVLAANIVSTSAPASASTVNSRDLMIQGASRTAPVELHFAGAERLELAAPGELSVIRHGSRQRYRPDAYQIINGKARHLTINYKLNGADRVTVSFGNFDNSAPIFLRDGASTL